MHMHSIYSQTMQKFVYELLECFLNLDFFLSRISPQSNMKVAYEINVDYVAVMDLQGCR